MSSTNRFPLQQPDDSEFTNAGSRSLPGVSDADQSDGDTRVSAKEAGYMELPNAQKDADCDAVNVPGGVSSQGGCCNLFRPAGQAQVFNCGSCTHVGTQQEQDTQQETPDQSAPQSPMSNGPATGQGGSNFS